MFYVEDDEGMQQIVGKRSLAVLLASKWISSIYNTNSLFRRKVMWIILKDLLGGDLEFSNIYAPNDYIKRIPLWIKIRKSYPNLVVGSLLVIIIWRNLLQISLQGVAKL